MPSYTGRLKVSGQLQSKKKLSAVKDSASCSGTHQKVTEPLRGGLDGEIHFEHTAFVVFMYFSYTSGVALGMVMSLGRSGLKYFINYLMDYTNIHSVYETYDFGDPLTFLLGPLAG